MSSKNWTNRYFNLFLRMHAKERDAINAWDKSSHNNGLVMIPADMVPGRVTCVATVTPFSLHSLHSTMFIKNLNQWNKSKTYLRRLLRSSDLLRKIHCKIMNYKLWLKKKKKKKNTGFLQAYTMNLINLMFHPSGNFC